MTDMHDTADLVSKALRRAWQLGQTYWQQADSEYQSHWKKADATQATFDQLVEDTRAAILTSNSGAQPAPSVPECWLPVPEKHPTFDPVDLRLSDGSVLCGCVPQLDGDYWWEGPSGEVFIDPKYASVTHWRLAAAPEAKP